MVGFSRDDRAAWYSFEVSFTRSEGWVRLVYDVVQQDGLDLGARRGVELPLGNDQQRVGSGHRGEQPRPLRAGEPGGSPAGPERHDAAQEMLQLRRERDRFGQGDRDAPAER